MILIDMNKFFYLCHIKYLNLYIKSLIHKLYCEQMYIHNIFILCVMIYLVKYND